MGTKEMPVAKNKRVLYQNQLATLEDLLEVKEEIINDLKALLESKSPSTKQWLKSKEVRELLQISPGTLQNLRINGTLSYTKVGGIIYYNLEEIQKMLV